MPVDLEPKVEEPVLRPSGRPNRPIRPPKHYQDMIPHPFIPVEHQLDSFDTDSDHAPSGPVGEDDEGMMQYAVASQPSPHPSDLDTWVSTARDVYDLFRQYHLSFPSYDPENNSYFDQFCDAPTFMADSGADENRPWYSGLGSTITVLCQNYFSLFLNVSTFRLMSWFYNSSHTKSLGDLDQLVNEVILTEDFNQEELRDFNAMREARRLDGSQSSKSTLSFFSAADRWQEATVEICLPCENMKMAEAEAPKFAVQGLYYRKFTEVLKAAYQEVTASTFHTAPFKLFWKPKEDQPPKRVISEIYTSNAMLEEHAWIQSYHHEPGCNLETVVAAIILWSGSTHLASFRNAALWPVYMFIGNHSKYARAKPSSFAAHHLAYIPKVCI